MQRYYIYIYIYIFNLAHDRTVIVLFNSPVQTPASQSVTFLSLSVFPLQLTCSSLVSSGFFSQVLELTIVPGPHVPPLGTQGSSIQSDQIPSVEKNCLTVELVEK